MDHDSTTKCRFAFWMRNYDEEEEEEFVFLDDNHNHHIGIGTGFSFDDGEQILVSVQKPLGLVLEQDHNDDDEHDNNDNIDSKSSPLLATKRSSSSITVAEVDLKASAGRAGIRPGDVLVAVQNASTVSTRPGGSARAGWKRTQSRQSTIPQDSTVIAQKPQCTHELGNNAIRLF